MTLCASLFTCVQREKSQPRKQAPLISADDALRSLVDIARVFEARGSRYMLADGTLLGAVRDGGFISWDHDTDLMVPIQGFNPRVLRDLFDEGFQLTRCFGFPEDGMEWTLERHGVYTDFFFVYPRDGSYYLSAYWWDNACGTAEDEDDGTAEWLDYIHPHWEDGRIELQGHSFSAPADPERYLAHCYGDSWRIPTDTWDYRRDPPNATRRPERISFTESFDAVSDYVRAGAGLAIERVPGWPLPFVRIELLLDDHLRTWLR